MLKPRTQEVVSIDTIIVIKSRVDSFWCELWTVVDCVLISRYMCIDTELYIILYIINEVLLSSGCPKPTHISSICHI